MSSSSESHGTHDLNAPVISAGDLVGRIEAHLASPHEAPALNDRLLREAAARIRDLEAALTVIRLTGWGWQGGGSDIRHPSEAAIIASDALRVSRDYPLGWPDDAEYEALRRARSSLNQDGGKP